MGIVEERHQTPRQNTPAGPVALGAAVGFCIWAQAGLVVNRAGSLAQLTLPRPILPLTQLVSWVALTAAVGAGTAMVAPSKDTPAAAAGARAALLGQVIGLISALFANGARHSQPQGPSLEPNSRELAHFSRRVGGGALGALPRPCCRSNGFLGFSSPPEPTSLARSRHELPSPGELHGEVHRGTVGVESRVVVVCRTPWQEALVGAVGSGLVQGRRRGPVAVHQCHALLALAAAATANGVGSRAARRRLQPAVTKNCPTKTVTDSA